MVHPTLWQPRFKAIPALILALTLVAACVTPSDRSGMPGQGQDVEACLKASSFYATQQSCGPNSRFASKAAVQAGREKYESFFKDPDPNKRLIRAVIAEEYEKAETAIKDGADVNRVHPGNGIGLTDPALPIDQAAKNLDIDMVQLLLRSGADPNVKQEPPRPSLLVANIVFQMATVMPDKDLNRKRKEEGLRILEAVLNAGYTVDASDLETVEDLGQRAWSPIHELNDTYLPKARRIVLAATPRAAREQLAAGNREREAADLKREQAYAEAARRRLQEQASAQEARIRNVSRVGQKVCQPSVFTGGGRSIRTTIIGYTERVVDGRVQIRMRGTDPYVPGPLIFENAPLEPDQLIWDKPANWAAC
ncbi:hypothetical protein J2847_000178 [Azospirillum agricola]|uniref:hypothetical protein n=1 Tax=Azospirillum agricola TaxID=1720247 RepID=UPI001AE58D46|nr:hypothetical protein [Azospirillum agricola]MBP2226911.1 hypothetical protein [Azospirillum agricola]